MEITIHTDIKKMDSDYKKAFEEYAKRTSPYCKIILKTYKNLSKPELKKGAAVIVIVPGSDTISSPGLAELISGYNLNGFSSLDFIIPSAQDLQVEAAAKVINISSFTLDTQLTTVVLAEQLYRAFTILNNITYHK